MRIGVGRLHGLLFRRKLVTQFQLVVPITGPFGEHRPEDVQIGFNTAEARGQPRGQALRKEAGGRVFGGVEMPAESSKRVAMHPRGEGPHIHDIQSGARSDAEREFNGRHGADKSSQRVSEQPANPTPVHRDGLAGDVGRPFGRQEGR